MVRERFWDRIIEGNGEIGLGGKRKKFLDDIKRIKIVRKRNDEEIMEKRWEDERRWWNGGGNKGMNGKI